jgi:hypothetical protein
LLASLDERRILKREVEAAYAHQAHKDDDEDPGLPVVERPGWQEEQDSKSDHAEKERSDCWNDKALQGIAFGCRNRLVCQPVTSRCKLHHVLFDETPNNPITTNMLLFSH